MGSPSLKATPGMIVAGTNRAERQAAWLLAAILFVASAYFYQDPEWNGNSRLNLTRAIVEQGTFAIDAYHEAPGWATGDKAFFQGHYYSDKAIGASMMAVPIYFLLHGASQALGLALSPTFIKHVLTTAVMGATFTLCGLAMYSIARQHSGRSMEGRPPDARDRTWHHALAVQFGFLRPRPRRRVSVPRPLPCSLQRECPKPAAHAVPGSGSAFR